MALAISLLILSTGSAKAQQPTISDVDRTFIDPFLSEHCGFTVQVHIDGKVVQFADGTEIPVRDLITFTNLSTGKSISIRVTGPAQFTQTTEGNIRTTVISFQGNDGQIVVPGQGVVAIQAGRVVYVLIEDISTEPPTVISEDIIAHGNFRDGITDDLICSLLS
jgi:hypothetical protein